MKERQKITKSVAAAATTTSNDGTPTHRLTQIAVNEVSIVDSAANQRKFLVVKHGKVAKDAASPATTPQAPAPPVPPSPPTAPTLQISPELKAKVLGVLKNAQEKIGIIQQVLEGSSETPGAPPPKELMDALTQLAQLFTPDATPAVTPPPAPAVPAPAAGTQKQEGTPAAPATTAKAGKKISAARLKQMQAIKDSFEALLTEVSETPADDDDDEAAAGTEPAKKSTEAVTTPAAGAPTAEITELKTSVASLVTAVGQMTQVFEGQNQRIDALAKSRGESRQVDPDAVVTKSEKVTWELDMAAPRKAAQ